MITIIDKISKNPLRHVSCPPGKENIQCSESETWVDGMVSFSEDTYEDTVEYKINQIIIKCSDAIKSIVKTTPEFEQATWPKQESEARAWLLDNEAFTPLLDGMIETRGDTKEYLVGKIIEKADIYAIEVGRLLGEKQRLEKELINSQNN
jgi:hypothetical protein